MSDPKTPPGDIWVGEEWQRHIRKLRKERAELLEALRNLVNHIDQCEADDCTCDQGPVFYAAQREIERTR